MLCTKSQRQEFRSRLLLWTTAALTGPRNARATRVREWWATRRPVTAARAGLRVLEIPVNHRRRAGGESKVSGTLRGTFVAGARIVTTLLRIAAEKSPNSGS